MARPKKDNAEYFSHDKDMRNDPKIKALRRKYREGYMVFSMLLEVLTGSDFFTIDFTPMQVELLAGDFDVDPEVLEQIVEYCVKINLLKREENLIYSCGLRKRLQPVLDNRNAVKQRFLDKKLQNKDVSKTENTQSKVKYSKVKESNIVVEEVIGDPAEILKKIEEEIFIDEDEMEAALKFLRKHTMYEIVQQHNSLDPGGTDDHFRIFYTQKKGFGELTGKTPNDLVRNFYYWVPKYLLANKPKPVSNGNANHNPRRNHTVAAGADEKRADRKQLVDSLRGLLRGTEPKE
jgi:hypothetical protein